ALGAGGKLVGTSLEKILPATIHENDIEPAKSVAPYVWRVEKATSIPLEPVGKHAILEGLSFADKPVTQFYHDVKPKADATVLIKAGNVPILIVGTYGKGRVALFTATLHGEPQAGATAYWKWKDWDRLVQNTVAWLAGK